jgi:hypothetical protein
VPAITVEHGATLSQPAVGKSGPEDLVAGIGHLRAVADLPADDGRLHADAGRRGRCADGAGRHGIRHDERQQPRDKQHRPQHHGLPVERTPTRLCR